MTTGIPEVEREAGGTKIVLARFFVEGEPRPAGSKTPTAVRRPGAPNACKGCGIVMIPLPGGKRRPLINVRDDADNGDWKKAVKWEAQRAYGGVPPTDATLSLNVEFVMPRPGYHFRTGRFAGELRDDAPHWHTCKPDATKLLRCLEDALTGILWVDDAQIVRQKVTKRYGKVAGAIVEVAFV